MTKHDGFEWMISTLRPTRTTNSVDVGRASISRNIAALLTSQLVTWSLATILSIMQPRLLGPESQGNCRLAFSLWTVASVVIGLGTSLFLTLEVSRTIGDPD